MLTPEEAALLRRARQLAFSNMDSTVGSSERLHVMVTAFGEVRIKLIQPLNTREHVALVELCDRLHTGKKARQEKVDGKECLFFTPTRPGR